MCILYIEFILHFITDDALVVSLCNKKKDAH